MNEVVEYSSWKTKGVERPLEFSSESLDALRAEGRYEIITPAECLARFRDQQDYSATLHPLIGGMPLDRAWQCMELYNDKVLVPLTAS